MSPKPSMLRLLRLPLSSDRPRGRFKFLPFSTLSQKHNHRLMRPPRLLMASEAAMATEEAATATKAADGFYWHPSPH